jgi:hypothetical protein
VTHVALLDKASTNVAVVSDVDPAEDPREGYQKGSALLILGSILDDPARRLPGYAGPTDRTTLWRGLHLVVEVADEGADTE